MAVITIAARRARAAPARRTRESVTRPHLSIATGCNE